MIGNRVRVRLYNPDEEFCGELRQQNSEGIWVYHGWENEAAVRFYPMHRVVQVEDAGYVHR